MMNGEGSTARGKKSNGHVEMSLSSPRTNGAAAAPAEATATADETRTIEALPQLAFSEINLGRVIGTGGFSSVYEIKSVDLDEIYDTSKHQSQLRHDFAKAVRSPPPGTDTSTFVLKKLRTDLSDRELQNGMEDLDIEAKFLLMLSHPNIIRMKGISQSDPQKARFFVILDRLSTTLDRKFNQWRRIVGESTGYWVPCYGYCCSNSAILHELWIERLGAARDIATALAFLHSKHIIYRDMKPDNVGFDINGELKVFDFGLAKKLDGGEVEQCGENYLLTGNTGSLRYMAPEVAQDKPYNTAVDVYSFAVLFWQICSLTTPYSGYSQAKHNLDVVFKGHRPRCDPSWPKEWKSVMQAGWNHVPSARPGMQEMVQNLTRILADDHLPAEVRIRAKIRRASVKSPVLDVDTRTEAAVASHEASAVTKRYNANIV